VIHPSESSKIKIGSSWPRKVSPWRRRYAFQVLKDSSMGFRSGEYGGKYNSIISIKRVRAIDKVSDNGMHTQVIQYILESVGVMNAAVIHDKDTVRVGKWLHDRDLNQDHEN